MSRSHAILAASLVGVVGLAGIARVVGGASEPEAAAASHAGPVARASVDPSADVAVVESELASDVRDELGLEPIAVIDPDCSLSIRLELGDEDPEVACLESQLIAVGAIGDGTPDEQFDAATDQAVRAFQEANGIVADGVVGPETASLLGSWVGPDLLPPDPDTCPSTGRAAVIDRYHQRTWLCEDGEIAETMPMTSAISQPDPGTYEVYAKDMNASSSFGGAYSTMTHFVAFAYGKYQGARIAFHSIPTYPNGDYVQPLDSVGTQALFGDSSGCIRVLPEDAELIWSWLSVGDTVAVVT